VYFASVRLALAVPDRDGHARRDHDRPQVAAYDVGVIPDFAQGLLRRLGVAAFRFKSFDHLPLIDNSQAANQKKQSGQCGRDGSYGLAMGQKFSSRFVTLLTHTSHD
jgi:hypothetical protein